TSPDPVAEAVTAGEDWGRRLATDPSRPRHHGPATSAVTALLADLGFAPEPAAATPGRVRLTRCPLLEVARQYPDVVCAVHLGLVRGALREYGAAPDHVDLKPFAEPGGCLLHLKRGETA